MPAETDPRKVKYTLDAEVRADQAKERAVFGVLHILDTHPPVLSDEGIVKALVEKYDIGVETERDAWHWLRRYKEKQQLDSEKEYLKEQARLSGEIDDINKTLARMDNRIGDDNG